MRSKRIAETEEIIERNIVVDEDRRIRVSVQNNFAGFQKAVVVLHDTGTQYVLMDIILPESFYTTYNLSIDKYVQCIQSDGQYLYFADLSYDLTGCTTVEEKGLAISSKLQLNAFHYYAYPVSDLKTTPITSMSGLDTDKKQDIKLHQYDECYYLLRTSENVIKDEHTLIPITVQYRRIDNDEDVEQYHETIILVYEDGEKLGELRSSVVEDYYDIVQGGIQNVDGNLVIGHSVQNTLSSSKQPPSIKNDLI